MKALGGGLLVLLTLACADAWAQSYPARAVRTEQFLYIRNYRPDRWPAGDPEMYFAVGPFGEVHR